jgi:hypothetical protein
MKRTILSIIIGVVSCLTFAPAVFAQTADNSVLYAPNVNLSSGTQNGYVGYIGGVFLSTYSYWPNINYLGYYDNGGNGLANSHEVSLWIVGGAGDPSSTPTLVASVTVPAGTSALEQGGYAWVQLPSTVGLYYGSWYVIEAYADGVDTWGDLLSNDQGAGQISWSDQYVNSPTDWSGNGWERAGRYGASEPPSNQTSANDSLYPIANMGYNLTGLTAVPEPTSFGLLGFGAALFFGLAQKRKQ